MPSGTVYANREIGMTHTPERMRVPARSRLEQAAFTLAEAVVTVAVSMMGLGGVMLMNAQQLRLVASTRESNAASWVLQDRLEHLRNVSWDHLTNADHLKTALADLPDCARLLPNYTERVTLVKSSEADKPGASKLIIERTAGGSPKTVSTGTGISTGVEVKVDVLVSWTGKGGRHRERSNTSIISDSGVSRTNIPGFGGPTGATPVDNGGTLSDSASPSDSGTTGGSSTTEPSQPVEDTKPGNGNGNSGNSGNGNGNGDNSTNGNGNPHGNTNQKPGQG
jgi:Tfp pilus assembly protein PilV